jgi:hypothetical protein
MQRVYLKTRNRNRNVYYGAKELAIQNVDNGKYEKLKQVSIAFIFEENTTPNAPPVAKLQLADTETNEVYTDLLTLYEVNLNNIRANQELPENLIILKEFLSIKTPDALKQFVTTRTTDFAQGLTRAYVYAIHNDNVLLQIEGSEKYMMKLTKEMLIEERREGEAEGRAEGETRGTESSIMIAIKNNAPWSLIEALAQNANISKERVDELSRLATA